MRGSWKGKSILHCFRTSTDVGSTITLTTPDPIELPLPDPRFLALHAACAKVAHASGAAEYIDRVLGDFGDVPVLDPNGSSYEALYGVLSLIAS